MILIQIWTLYRPLQPLLMHLITFLESYCSVNFHTEPRSGQEYFKNLRVYTRFLSKRRREIHKTLLLYYNIRIKSYISQAFSANILKNLINWWFNERKNRTFIPIRWPNRVRESNPYRQIIYNINQSYYNIRIKRHMSQAFYGLYL